MSLWDSPVLFLGALIALAGGIWLGLRALLGLVQLYDGAKLWYHRWLTRRAFKALCEEVQEDYDVMHARIQDLMFANLKTNTAELAARELSKAISKLH